MRSVPGMFISVVGQNDWDTFVYINPCEPVDCRNYPNKSPIPDPNDCARYFECAGKSDPFQHHKSCPEDELWDVARGCHPKETFVPGQCQKPCVTTTAVPPSQPPTTATELTAISSTSYGPLFDPCLLIPVCNVFFDGISYPDSENCSMYYLCTIAAGLEHLACSREAEDPAPQEGLTQVAEPLLYDAVARKCDLASNVERKGRCQAPCEDTKASTTSSSTDEIDGQTSSGPLVQTTGSWASTVMAEEQSTASESETTQPVSATTVLHSKATSAMTEPGAVNSQTTKLDTKTTPPDSKSTFLDSGTPPLYSQATPGDLVTAIPPGSQSTLKDSETNSSDLQTVLQESETSPFHSTTPPSGLDTTRLWSSMLSQNVSSVFGVTTADQYFTDSKESLPAKATTAVEDNTQSPDQPQTTPEESHLTHSALSTNESESTTPEMTSLRYMQTEESYPNGSYTTGDANNDNNFTARTVTQMVEQTPTAQPVNEVEDQTEQPVTEEEQSGTEQPMTEEEQSGTEQPVTEEEQSGTEQPVTEEEQSGTEQPVTEEEQSGTEQPVTEEEQSGTEQPVTEEEQSGTEQPVTEEEQSGTEQPVTEEEQSGTEQPVTEEEQSGTKQPVTEEEQSGTEQPVTEEEQSGTEQPVTEEEQSGTEQPVTEEEQSGTKQPVTEEEQSGTEQPVTEEEQSGTEQPVTEEEQSGTEQPVTEEEQSGTEQPVTEEEQSGTEQPVTEEEQSGTEQPVTEEEQSGTEQPLTKVEGQNITVQPFTTTVEEGKTENPITNLVEDDTTTHFAMDLNTSVTTLGVKITTASTDGAVTTMETVPVTVDANTQATSAVEPGDGTPSMGSGETPIPVDATSKGARFFLFAIFFLEVLNCQPFL